jgi:hypothetical protein
MPADDVVDRKALVDQWARELRQEGPPSGTANEAPPQGVVAEEGWFSQAVRKYGEYRDAAKSWARDMGEAVGIKLFDPPAAQSARQEAAKALAGRPEYENARRYAKGYDIGHGAQDVSGAVGAVSGEGAAEVAISAGEAEVGGRVAGGTIGAVKGVAGAGRAAATEARAAEEAIEAAQAEAKAGRAAGRAETAETRLLSPGPSSGSTATQIGTRRLPNVENPWIKYQKHVTGLSYEDIWRLNADKVGVDASRAGYTVEAKWAGKNNAAWRSPPYNPRSEFYNEPGILDQARNLIELNKASGGSGVRYAVSNDAARAHFEALFRQHFRVRTFRYGMCPGRA